VTIQKKLKNCTQGAVDVKRHPSPCAQFYRYPRVYLTPRKSPLSDGCAPPHRFHRVYLCSKENLKVNSVRAVPLLQRKSQSKPRTGSTAGTPLPRMGSTGGATRTVEHPRPLVWSFIFSQQFLQGIKLTTIIFILSAQVITIIAHFF